MKKNSGSDCFLKLKNKIMGADFGSLFFIKITSSYFLHNFC